MAQARGASAGVAPLRLEHVAADAAERSETWRRAYLNDMAASAIEAGAWRSSAAHAGLSQPSTKAR